MKNKKTDLAGKIFAGVVIGGSILGTTAFLLSAPYQADYQVESIQPVEEIEMTAEVIAPEPKKPVLAIVHEEQGVDFVELANQAMNDGDLKGSFTALRKSLHGGVPTVETLLRIGRIGREIGELELAEMALREAENLDANLAEVHVELARIYLRRDQHEQAHDEATKAIGLDKEHAAAWNLVGRSAMSMSNWQRAEAALARAVELDPLNAMYRNNLGLLFIHMKRADDAIDELETAVELFEDEAPHFAFNNLGLAHEMAGNYEEARAAFEEALTVSPFYARAKVNLDRIEKRIAQVEEKAAFDTAKTLEPKIDFESQESL
jgi:tetratricopeptide (TPR) repeat protein